MKLTGDVTEDLRIGPSNNEVVDDCMTVYVPLCT